MKPVSLQRVVNEMDVLDDEMTAYISKQTGELFTISDEEARLIEDGEESGAFVPDWQVESLPKIKEILESDDFVALPDKFEIHEYSIMERFCLSIEDDDLRGELLHDIRGRGAFRCFKSTIRREGIQDDWHSYRNDALKRVAADFLEEEGIPYIDDDDGS
ncbi:MAG: hypothetical protein KZQ95_21460 [Candidatus Thiodiazotropha sp. (ex Epidulcina cf. delphinae)]|nr:hypothetical protein [Candidatus Thiodiazotropha sp. (ex Epidulcina cf. delphinae)]